MLQEERDQVLSAGTEDIRALADLVQAMLDTESLCVIGNEEKINENKNMFNEVKNLYHG